MRVCVCFCLCCRILQARQACSHYLLAVLLSTSGFHNKEKGLKGKCAREGVSFGFVPEYFEVPKVAATTFSRFFSVPLVFIINKKS